MITDLLLPQIPGLTLLDSSIAQDTITLSLATALPSANCPVCSLASTHVHSHYRRRAADLPWADLTLRLSLQVRRFFCDNPSCKRVIFCERLHPHIAAFHRRTQRADGQLLRLGFALGAAGAAKIATELGMKVSPSTMLRLIRRAPMPVPPTPAVLGVDDWAKRKGQTYGTILVDLERHKVVDLLPERSAEAFANWLRAHPGVQIISRDRASCYAEGACEGAPAAIQVADRWHLLYNLGGALKAFLQRHATQLHLAAKQAATAVVPDSVGAPAAPSVASATTETAVTALPTSREAKRRWRRNRRAPSAKQLRFAEVGHLHQQGMSERAIALQLQVDRRTVGILVRRYQRPARIAAAQCPLAVRPYLAYLERRWMQGQRNQHELWRELQQQGYSGSFSSVWRALEAARENTRAEQGKQRASSTVRRLSVSHAKWLLMRREEELSAEDRSLLDALQGFCPALGEAHSLAQAFIQMIRQRKVEALDPWLTTAQCAGISELRKFAAGLWRDYAAVKAALELPWSSGQVEGQVNRLKMIKRTMFGHANFDLLRARILYTA